MTQRRDIVLFALAAALDGSLSPVQVQKAMFVLSEEVGDLLGPDFYKFIPYNYGPFNSDIYSDVGALESAGLVKSDKSVRWPVYTITRAGQQQADVIRQQIDRRLAEYIATVVHWVKTKTFSELLNSIYAKYPAYAVNSVFKQ